MGIWNWIRGKKKEEGGITDLEAIPETPKTPDLGLPINEPSMPSFGQKHDDPISIKIDTLNAKIDRLSERITNIERILMELNGQRQPPVQPMQPAQPQPQRQWYPK